MPRFRAVLAASCLIVFCISILDAQRENKNSETSETSPIESALQRRVIDPELPLKEVQEFTEQRVLPVPEFESIPQWELFQQQTRERLLKEVVLRGAAAEWAQAPTVSEEIQVRDMGDYLLRKLRFEALPGLWIPAVMYEPKNLSGKAPVFLNVNGHDGTGKAAEYKQIRCINQAKRGIIALNLEWVGMGQLRTPGFVHYKMNQLDLCGTSGLAVHYLSQKRALDILLQHPNADPERVGVAGLSGGGWQTIFISGLDGRVTLSNPVAGYSSFKTRARYTSDLGDSEQTPSDLATVADYSLLTAMLAPHPALLTNNVADNCCFKAEHAQPPLVHAAAPLYELYDREAWLRTHVNHDPGTHNFQRDNREQLYKMIGDHFFGGLQPVVAHYNTAAMAENQITVEELRQFLGSDARPYVEKQSGLFADVRRLMKQQAPALKRPDLLILVSRHFDGRTPENLASTLVPVKSGEVALSELLTLTPLKMPNFQEAYSATEIDCTDELKTVEELDVPLPENNLDFHQLAMALSNGIAKSPLPPGKAPRSWLLQHRQELRDLVSYHDYDVYALLEKEEQHEHLTVKHWWLRVGGLWTVPATEFIPETNPVDCVVMLADEGRGSLSGEVSNAIENGSRVLAIDPFYFGESKISQRDFLYGLLVSTIGERNLGIQASQIAAISQWAGQSQPTLKVTVSAFGPRMSLMALVASACEPQTANRLVLQDSFATLKQVIEQDLTVQQMPELFCFGLLKQFDIPFMIALSGAESLQATGNIERQQTEWREFLEEATAAGPEVSLTE
ncbi:MAG: acetylxylan esterase [Planctomycetaceae bacterium]|nr:acetylxylan esterase [Planctomycetaceae bacterium]